MKVFLNWVVSKCNTNLVGISVNVSLLSKELQLASLPRQVFSPCPSDFRSLSECSVCTARLEDSHDRALGPFDAADG